ncbi:hypothetical protein CEXT_533831 [Caerostris extrusa]|uniref:Uncharacterized protein n=1 Tax=Caerostris extrusa TaxID=172846 RepID=A0AAV4P3R4_CAEEX|nr:hypothetical protein CEXT_533831 [Caerostris extrusa]
MTFKLRFLYDVLCSGRAVNFKLFYGIWTVSGREVMIILLLLNGYNPFPPAIFNECDDSMFLNTMGCFPSVMTAKVFENNKEKNMVGYDSASLALM